MAHLSMGIRQRAARWSVIGKRSFVRLPSPEKQKEYMRRLTARPHHVGSPYDKDNAEWILAKFKEWGLDAHIETFDVLFPTPKEMKLEMVEPRKVAAEVSGAADRGGPDVQSNQ